MTESMNLWDRLRARQHELQNALGRTKFRDLAAEDVAGPLYQVVGRPDEVSRSWAIQPPADFPLAFYRQQHLKAVLDLEPARFGNCVWRNALLADHAAFNGNPNRYVVVGMNLAPVLRFRDVAHTLLVRRDAGAPSFPNCLNFLGGVSTENPALTPIKEINEEAAVFVKQDNGGLVRPRFVMGGRDCVDEAKRNADLPRILDRLYAKYPETRGREITEQTINIAIDEAAGRPSMEQVSVLDDHAKIASSWRGIIMPRIDNSMFDTIMPAALDWAKAGLRVTEADQVICIDAEDMTALGGPPRGREIHVMPIPELIGLPANQIMPHVMFARDVWRRNGLGLA